MTERRPVANRLSRMLRKLAPPGGVSIGEGCVQAQFGAIAAALGDIEDRLAELEGATDRLATNQARDEFRPVLEQLRREMERRSDGRGG